MIRVQVELPEKEGREVEKMLEELMDAGERELPESQREVTWAAATKI